MEREITKYDSEGVCKIYRFLKKKCELIDKSIYKAGISFSVFNCSTSGFYVVDYITDLMEGKNKLINFKLAIDDCITKLKLKDRQMILIKIHYGKLTVEEIGGILKIKQRTVFRHIEKAYEHLAEILNESKYKDKIIRILEDPMLKAEVEDITQRRKSFNGGKKNCK